MSLPCYGHAKKMLLSYEIHPIKSKRIMIRLSGSAFQSITSMTLGIFGLVFLNFISNSGSASAQPPLQMQGHQEPVLPCDNVQSTFVVAGADCSWCKAKEVQCLAHGSIYGVEALIKWFTGNDLEVPKACKEYAAPENQCVKACGGRGPDDGPKTRQEIIREAM